MGRAELAFLVALGLLAAAISFDWPTWTWVTAGVALGGVVVLDQMRGWRSRESRIISRARPVDFGMLSVPSGTLSLVDNAMLLDPSLFNVVPGKYRATLWLSTTDAEEEILGRLTLIHEDGETTEPVDSVMQGHGTQESEGWSDTGYWMLCDASFVESTPASGELTSWMRAQCDGEASRPVVYRSATTDAILFPVWEQAVEWRHRSTPLPERLDLVLR